MTPLKHVSLATGITMAVADIGPRDALPVILLHGFPESHRTWAALPALLGDRFRLIMPDLRGFGQSDRPQDVAAYSTDALVADLFALADALDVDRFALVGHDWGGAVAWAAVLREARETSAGRITRLAIVNSPHPAIFQRSIIEDRAQRLASQYISAFRDPGMEAKVMEMGVDRFFDKSYRPHCNLSAIDPADRALSIAEWSRPGALTAMFNWYRASHIMVPAMDAAAELPDWLNRLPHLKIPLRVIWGLDDAALLRVQLENIGEVGDDVELVPLPGVGHFAPWQAPHAVADALAPFLGAGLAARGAPS